MMTVKQKQLMLCFFDCMTPDAVDGIWGPQSAEATCRLQKRLGIAADGIFGQNTEGEVLNALVSGEGLPEATGDAVTPATGTFWDEIEYWTREEFRCQCGGKYCNGFPAEPDETLVRLVNDLRKQAGRPAHRSSGLRCPTWNAIQGGVGNSKHMYGKALDFYIEGVSGAKLLAMAQADKRTSYAYIIEGQYVHVDVA